MQNRKWNFDNSYAKLPDFFYTRQNPVPVRMSELVIFNDELADFLNTPSQPEVFAGNAVPDGAKPLAQAYSGHQFGHFTMLGDGRAILLGEQINSSGERFDIQLKGSGQTPYSRDGDGRAALGPMLREYIISEAMHALGISTTRSLAVVTTGETVKREEILSGEEISLGAGVPRRERLLPGAILTRVAKSHIRVGTFEYASRFGRLEYVRNLADYTITRHFPNITEADDKYLLMLREVVKSQAYLISKWQLAGFIHGVMNTDNMAVSGETIDYGPCAFMDTYNPATVFSSIDRHGRYSYQNQPQIAAWNLARFAETLFPLLHEDENEAFRIGREEIIKFQALFEENLLAGMRAKLGLFDHRTEDESLIGELLQLMRQYEADYTNTFHALTRSRKQDTKLFSSPAFKEWNKRWDNRLHTQVKTEKEVKMLLKSSNPAVIPRNHRVEEALAAAEHGDFKVMANLLKVLKNPYDYTCEQEAYAQAPSPNSCQYKTFCGT